MTRIETALERMLHGSHTRGVNGFDPNTCGSLAADALATPTGQALSALVEAAEAWRDDELIELDPALAAAVDDFRVATEPQTAGGES